MAPAPATRRFGVVLASRGNDRRPSDLEFALRSHCQRVDVKGRPLSGAHLVFTADRMAVRAYYPCDLDDLPAPGHGPSAELASRAAGKDGVRQHQEMQKQQGRQDPRDGRDGKGDDAGEEEEEEDDDDFDNLSKFLRSFQLALVLFVLPDANAMRRQLDDTTSFFHRAQRLVRRLAIQNKNKNLRVMLLPDTDAAVDSLICVANSITPERVEFKRAYYERIQEKYFLPPTSSSSSSVMGMGDRSASASSAAAAASHVAEALRQLGKRFDWPDGEADVLVTMLPDLQSIATADDDILDGIPIEERTKRVLHAFFGSKGRQPQQQQHQPRHGMGNVLNSTSAVPSFDVGIGAFSAPHYGNHYDQSHHHQEQQPFSHGDDDLFMTNLDQEQTNQEHGDDWWIDADLMIEDVSGGGATQAYYTLPSTSRPLFGPGRTAYRPPPVASSHNSIAYVSPPPMANMGSRRPDDGLHVHRQNQSHYLMPQHQPNSNVTMLSNVGGGPNSSMADNIPDGVIMAGQRPAFQVFGRFEAHPGEETHDDGGWYPDPHHDYVFWQQQQQQQQQQQELLWYRTRQYTAQQMAQEAPKDDPYPPRAQYLPRSHNNGFLQFQHPSNGPPRGQPLPPPPDPSVNRQHGYGRAPTPQPRFGPRFGSSVAAATSARFPPSRGHRHQQQPKRVARRAG